MSFRLRWEPEATRTFEQLRIAAERAASKRTKNKASKQEGLFKQVAKAVKLLSEDPHHPGLQTHPYSSLPHPFDATEKVFEAHAQNRAPGVYRVFWCYGPGKGVITLIAITPHP